MPLVTEAWDTASLRLLSQAGADGEGAEQYLRKIVENTQDTHLLALLDKNSETSEWRKIWLFKASDDRWLLLDEEGERRVTRRPALGKHRKQIPQRQALVALVVGLTRQTKRRGMTSGLLGRSVGSCGMPVCFHKAWEPRLCGISRIYRPFKLGVAHVRTETALAKIG